MIAVLISVAVALTVVGVISFKHGKQEGIEETHMEHALKEPLHLPPLPTFNKAIFYIDSREVVYRSKRTIYVVLPKPLGTRIEIWEETETPARKLIGLIESNEIKAMQFVDDCICVRELPPVEYIHTN